MEKPKRPGPQPKPIAERRIEKIQIPMTTAEKEVLYKAAGSSGMSVAEYIRRRVLPPAVSSGGTDGP